MQKNSLVLVLLFLCLGKMYGQWSGSPDSKTIVSSAIFDNKFPMAVPSGDGGSIVVFANYAEVTDDGTFPLPALCLQKIKSDGTVAWGTTESPIIIDSTIEDEWFSEPKLQVKADGYGGVYVLWAQVFYKDSIFVQHIDSSGRPLWGPTGKLVYSMENQQFAPGLSICVGSDSSVIVGWNSMNNATNRYSLYAQRYNILGAELWGANGKNVCPAIGSRMGQLIPDGANGIIAFFNDSRNSGMYGQRIDSGGNFRWTAEGINICPVPGARYISPGITHYGEASYAVADGNGGIIVMFNDKRNVTLDSMFGQAVENNIDIYAQKIDADGNLPWGQAGVAVAIRKARVNDICEKVFSDGNGGAIVQYENVSNMVDGTCKLTQRISADGDRQWGDSGIVLTRGRIDEFYSNIQTDESGNTYAGFLYIPQPYHEFATPLLSVRKIDINGQDLWGADGTIIRNAIPFSHPFFGPAITPQNDGSAIIAWSEWQTYPLIIAAAKLLPDGSLAKTPTTFTTIADGNWDDPSVWTNGMVPDSDAIVIVRNQVVINVNITCYSLKVEQPTGQIKVNPNITVNITH